MNKTLLLSISTIFLFSCSKKLEVTDFDSQTWINDTKGLNGQRIEQLSQLKNQKGNFIECTESSVKELLGQPDDQNLLPRMGRRYYYYVTPSSIDSINKSNPVIVEFEHRGLVRLMIVPSPKLILKTITTE